MLDREQMAKLMVEIHVLESKVNRMSIRPRDSAEMVYKHFETQLFEELGISKEQYDRSFAFYLDNPDEYEKVYITVVDSLMQLEKIKK